MSELVLDANSRNAWHRFLANQSNFGHAQRKLVGQDIDTHINACLSSARDTALRISKDLIDFKPSCILEIGCSTGLNCLAASEIYPEAQIIGIEPETEAIVAAKLLLSVSHSSKISFVQGVGEQIPLPSGSVDLVLCHTVIEHVKNVAVVISEMARVISPSGVIHLEAPNYVWPYEPHLDVWTIPKLGKLFVALCARAQGHTEMLHFLEHLQFVTPFQLENLATQNGLFCHNRVNDKIQNVIMGQNDVKKYKRLAQFIVWCGQFGLAKPVISAIVASGCYPSVMYTFGKKSL